MLAVEAVVVRGTVAVDEVGPQPDQIGGPDPVRAVWRRDLQLRRCPEGCLKTHRGRLFPDFGADPKVIIVGVDWPALVRGRGPEQADEDVGVVPPGHVR